MTFDNDFVIYAMAYFYNAGFGLGFGLGFRIKTQWLHCTIQKFSHCTESDSDSKSQIGLESEHVPKSVSRIVNEPLDNLNIVMMYYYP